MYNKDNVFYKILQSELPANKIYEDDVALAFYDIHPQKKVHALVITKGLYLDFPDFVAKASALEVKNFFCAVAHIAEILGVSQTGYRILSNIGPDSGQEVPHFHVHILGGEKLSVSL
jgi:diadenosine tetraphosphate (Ap4A) HIT family hydrolase